METLPFILFHGPNVTSMHDNACPHSAAITRQFLAKIDVNVLDWPANGPDLNPLEQVWDELERRVRKSHATHTENDLAEALQAEWANLPGPFIQHEPPYHSVHCTKWWTHEIRTHFMESSVSFY